MLRWRVDYIGKKGSQIASVITKKAPAAAWAGDRGPRRRSTPGGAPGLRSIVRDCFCCISAAEAAACYRPKLHFPGRRLAVSRHTGPC
jgi:hypothetical protein